MNWDEPGLGRYILSAVAVLLTLGVIVAFGVMIFGQRSREAGSAPVAQVATIAPAATVRPATVPPSPLTATVPAISTRPSLAVLTPAATATQPGLAAAAPPPPAATVSPPTAIATAPEPTASAAVEPENALRQRAAAAEAALRAGEIRATIEYGNDTRSLSTLRFDLGNGQQSARLHIVSAHQGPTRTNTVERLVDGERWWQRQADGAWTTLPPQEGALGSVYQHQIQAFLPRVALVPSLEVMDSTGETTTLGWYDASRDADVTLVVATSTGIPRELRQVTRGTGAVLTVTYQNWNMPVEIQAPPPS